MRKPTLLLLLQLLAFAGFSQLSENFDDGNYTADPPWTPGAVTDWTVNSNLQLQSNITTANSSFFISTPSTLATTAQWEFWVRLAFNTSSVNYVDVYLTASAGNLAANSTTGYFVRIGNTQDEISLYRKDANGTTTKLIDGTDGITDKSDNVLKIRVVRNAANQFTLFRDVTGSGNNHVSEGSATDATYHSSAFFGFLVRQSTSSFFQKHFFDDIEVSVYEPDATPPVIESVTAVSPSTAEVLFSEPVELASAKTVNNYLVNNGVGSPVSATRSSTNSALVQLSFATAFANGAVNTLTVNGIKDLAGNVLQNGTITFSFYLPQAYDVVIDEIMCNPTPQAGLPNTKFIELKNVSGRPINLQGWRLSSASAVSAAFPAYNLPADSFVVITSTSSAASLTQYGNVLGVGSFPSLLVGGTMLILTSREGRTIHAVDYKVEWYQNPVKADGGWSLEMIDTRNPCTGAGNWKASTDPKGGTPGRKNLVDAVNNDTSPPQLLRTYGTDSLTVIAIFNDPLDSASASLVTNYTWSNGLTISTAKAQPPLFNRVALQLSAPLQRGTFYTLTARGVKDCQGNEIGSYNKAKAGWAGEATERDMVVNEILFDPRPGGSDYAELYNRSNKIIDASTLYIASRNGSGAVASLKKIAEEPFSLFPGDYLVVTPDKTGLIKEFHVKNEEAVLQLSSLPSFPDDKGTVVLLNASGDVIDEVSYHKNWHFALISNAEGVALERIDPDGPSQNTTNWHSAASTAGYGTPSYQNSQYKVVDDIKAMVEVSPPVFSPDNDGRDDVALIHYQVAERGFVANVLIFDAGGRLVRSLVRNELLSLKGFWKWDGLGESMKKLPVGTYVVFTEIFNLEGKKKGFKNTVVLARIVN